MADRPPELGEEDEDDMAPLGAAATLPAGRPAREARGAKGDGPKRRRRLPRPPVGVGALLLLLAVVLLALAPTLGSTLKKTPRDQVGISYGGGPIEAARFQRIVQPGSSLFVNGFLDKLYLYPADQRNYIISRIAGEGDVTEADAVTAPSQDQIQVEYQVATYFKLNTDLLRPFHEQLGLRYSAYTDDGWKRLLQDTFRQQIEATLQEETRRYPVADIFSDADVLLKIQGEVQATLRTRLTAALGRQYFCGPTFTPGGECSDMSFVIKRIDIPASVAAAFELNRVSLAQVVTKRNEIAQREAEAEGFRRLIEAGIPPEDIKVIRATEEGRATIYFVPIGSNVVLPAPAPGTGEETPTTIPEGGAGPDTTVPGG